MQYYRSAFVRCHLSFQASCADQVFFQKGEGGRIVFAGKGGLLFICVHFEGGGCCFLLENFNISRL